MEWNDFFKLLTEYKNSIREHDKNPSLESMERYKQAYSGMRKAFFALKNTSQPVATLDQNRNVDLTRCSTCQTEKHRNAMCPECFGK